MPGIPSTTVDVPLSLLDQQSPGTSGPIGRLSSLINAIVTKYQPTRVAGGNTSVRVEKRPAFHALSTVVRNASSGAVVNGADLSNQTLLAPFNDQLVLVASNAQVNVYSDTASSWERHAYQVATHTLRQTVAYTANSQEWVPDLAYASGAVCAVWFEIKADGTNNRVRCAVLDADGVYLRAPFTLNTTDTRVKVVSDGTRFWILSDNAGGTGNPINVALLDASGGSLSTTTIGSIFATGLFWDVTYIAGTNGGVTLAQPVNTGGVKFTRFTWNGSVIAQASSTDVTVQHSSGLAWLANSNADGKGYLATVFSVSAGNNTVFAYQVVNLAKTHQYTVRTGQADGISNITGYATDDASGDVVVAFTLLDTVTPLNNVTTVVYASFGGSSSVFQTFTSVGLASRAFRLGAQRYYAVVYYQSVSSFQPTWFLMPINGFQNVAGRWEYGQAYMDWPSADPLLDQTHNFSLASAVTGANGQVLTSLCYRAESFTAATKKSDVVVTQAPANTVGVKIFSFGSDSGQALRAGNELLIPGPIATSFTGVVPTESGFNLAPEKPTHTIAGSGLTGPRGWVVVYEYTDNNGDRVRSIPSPVDHNTTGEAGGNHQYTLTGKMLHATARQNVCISIYRSVVSSGLESSNHYKVTSDLAPLYNADGSATWSFTDTGDISVGLDDASVKTHEILYTDQGFLERHPAPPFSASEEWQGRGWVVAYDNSIWMSGPKNEGDARWFHPGLRIPFPPGDPIVALAAMENLLVVLCARSVWYLPRTTLPDATGSNGVLPEPQPVPTAQGCTGFAETVTGLGVVYTSTAGGAWVIGRDLSVKRLSAAAVDDFVGTVTGIAVDGNERIAFAFSDRIMTYDTIVGAWYRWTPPTPTPLLCVWKGALTYGSGFAVWRQVPGSYADQIGLTVIPINTSITISPIHFASVRGYRRVWAMQLIGQTYTAAQIAVQLSYDDKPEILQTKTFLSDPAVPFEYEIQPVNELCSAIGLTISDSFPGGTTPGQSFALELVSFYVGLQPKGLNRIPINRRV